MRAWSGVTKAGEGASDKVFVESKIEGWGSGLTPDSH